MRLRRDDSAASPLVVLATFVLAAVLVTIVAYAVAFDRPEPGVSLVERREGGALAFEVTRASGSLSWGEVDVRFVDRGGSDVAAAFLHLPTGPIGRADRIEVGPQPPAGTYLVQVLHEGEELTRLVVTV